MKNILNKFKIFGNKKLIGEINISGSKNISMSIIISTILSNKLIILKNVPAIKDVKILLKILKLMGSDIYMYNNICYINNKNINKYDIKYKIIKKIRSSILLLGPMLSKFGKFFTLMPGGCKIGQRPIDLHINNIKKLNVKIFIYKNRIISFNNKKNINSANKIFIEKISVGATLNMIFISVISSNIIEIINGSLDIDVVETIKFLNYIGADIKIINKKIIIKGVNNLIGGIYNILYDRIELGTFLIASCITKGDITCNNVIYNNELKILLYKLKKSGANIYIKKNSIRLKIKNIINPISIKTNNFPGFPTDLQPQICLLNSISLGKSIITENIFENRFNHIYELNKMGADFKLINKNTLLCNGVKNIYGNNIYSTDLRSTATLILAGCVANDITIVNNINYIYRGYEKFDLKLNKLGADIKKIF